jgi:hypothetical protein
MNKLKATHEGIINIGETSLKVAVLEDGSRIINYSAIFKAFGRTKRGAQIDGSRVHNMPAFLNANNLQPFVGKDLMSVLNKVDYIDLNGKNDSGYDASILPMLCKVYLDARQEKILKSQQIPLARASEILLIGLSKIGIIALVDEATGYQYDREKFELQSILQTFISEEIFKWQETFQLSFYKEIFRLWNVPFTAANIKRKPMFIGKLTSELVYKNLPKGVFVLNKLKEKTPKTESGNYKYRLHQSLTPEVGREALKKVIYSVEALASISDSKLKFLKLMKEKYNPDLQLNLFTELDNLASKEDKKEVILKNE